MAIDSTMLVLAFVCGALLAAVYWSSLWFTVQQISHSRHPALVLLTSLILRLSLVLVILYNLIDGGHWVQLMVAIASFIAVRTIFIHLVRYDVGLLRKRGQTSA